VPTNISASVLRSLILQNQLIPTEGPVALALGPIDLTQNNGLYYIDLSQLMNQARISMIQTLFIDCSQSGVPVAVKDTVTGHELVANPHTQGFYTFLCQNPARLQINGPGGPSDFLIFACNVPIPTAVWNATHP
jgi:hypothetical protein